MAEISKIKLPSGNTYDLKDSVARSTTEAINTALAGKQDTIDAQHKLDYSLIANTPTIPPADYVAMIDITTSTNGGSIQYTAAIVSGTFAEIDAALLAQKTVLVIGRYPTTNPVSYQYFRSGYHMPTAEIVFTSTGGEMIGGAVTTATWYPAANGEPERVLVGDGTGIIDVYPTGDGNAVTSIEKNSLFSFAIVNKDKTFVDTAQQTLTDAQKSQARTNIGAGTYSKPVSGIPASDLAPGVIPDVSQFITNSVNDLVNYYLKSEVYTKDEVASLIGAIQQFHYEIAASTSAVSDPQPNVLYLIGPSGTGSDKYEEYVYSNGWVKIGDTSIDLSGYVTGLNKGDGDNVLGESTSFTTAPSAVSFAAHTTETFVKSVKAETNKKLVTTTVPNVTSVGSASTWNFSMGTGADAETLIVSGGNGTAPTLGTEKTVATGATDANGTGSPIVTGVTVGSSAAAITALGAATAAAQTITVGTNDKVKVAKYDDLSVNKN